MLVATFIAEGLELGMLHEAAYEFGTMSLAGRTEQVVMLDEGWAGDIIFRPSDIVTPDKHGELAAAMQHRAWAIAAGGFGRELHLDVVVQPLAGREKRLLVADMDSTMITVECIDELADYAGIKAEVAAVTEAAMRGELDFAAALDARVALLEGLDEAAIERCLDERVRIMPGAETLVRTMKARGALCVLVSGGFTRFAEPVAERIGFDRAIANRLLVEDGRLTGRVAKPIVAADTKLRTLEACIAERGIARAESLAVGDGANDLPMVQAAGLGVAYHAKPVVAAAAAARIDHGDLRALLWAQGIPRRDWVTG